jgi:hypothetical protein
MHASWLRAAAAMMLAACSKAGGQGLMSGEDMIGTGAFICGVAMPGVFAHCRCAACHLSGVSI